MCLKWYYLSGMFILTLWKSYYHGINAVSYRLVLALVQEDRWTHRRRNRHSDKLKITLQYLVVSFWHETHLFVKSFEKVLNKLTGAGLRMRKSNEFIAILSILIHWSRTPADERPYKTSFAHRMNYLTLDLFSLPTDLEQLGRHKTWPKCLRTLNNFVLISWALNSS